MKLTKELLDLFTRLVNAVPIGSNNGASGRKLREQNDRVVTICGDFRIKVAQWMNNPEDGQALVEVDRLIVVARKALADTVAPDDYGRLSVAIVLAYAKTGRHRIAASLATVNLADSKIGDTYKVHLLNVLAAGALRYVELYQATPVQTLGTALRDQSHQDYRGTLYEVGQWLDDARRIDAFAFITAQNNLHYATHMGWNLTDAIAEIYKAKRPSSSMTPTELNWYLAGPASLAAAESVEKSMNTEDYRALRAYIEHLAGEAKRILVEGNAVLVDVPAPSARISIIWIKAALVILLSIGSYALSRAEPPVDLSAGGRTPLMRNMGDFRTIQPEPAVLHSGRYRAPSPVRPEETNMGNF